jgi:hypothetical protein
MTKAMAKDGSSGRADGGLRMLSGEEALRATRTILERLAREGIVPNVDSILAITKAGDLPVLVFEPGEKVAADLKKGLGWSGNGVFGVPKWIFAEALQGVDPQASRWVVSEPPEGGFRLFVYINDGTLLMNWAPGRGLWLEPGSYGPERLN